MKRMILNSGDSELIVDLDAFVLENIETLEGEEIAVICGLQPGERYDGGGGASPVWSIAVPASEAA